jgi:glycosyltransferase involved in cell wall biosynthesis
MAYGLSVLASEVGAAPEIVTNTVNGYLVPYGSAPPLSTLVDRIQSNRSHLATLAYFARQHFEAHPTWDASMRQVDQWLQRIASQHASRTTRSHV